LIIIAFTSSLSRPEAALSMNETVAANRLLIAREDRSPYNGPVRVSLGFDPWRIVLTLRGLNLSRTGLCAHWATASAEAKREQADAESLLVTGDTYEMQLDHDMPHLPSPLVQGRLLRKARTNSGLELAFHLVDSDVGLLGLIHEIKQEALS